MKKYPLIKLLILFGSLSINAQLTPEFPFATTCANAPVICDLDGYTAAVPSGYNSIDQPLTFCHWVHNNYWISFIAGSEVIVLDVSITNCGYVTKAGGFFAQVYATCGIPWTSASNCLYDVDHYSTATLTMQGLTIGDQYYLMIDGQSGHGEICEFTIEVAEGFTMPSSTTIIADAGDDKVKNCQHPYNVILDGSNSVYGVNDSIYWAYEDEVIVGEDVTQSTGIPGRYFFMIKEEEGCITSDYADVYSFDDNLNLQFVTFFPESVVDPVFLEMASLNVLDSNYVFSWTTDGGNIISHADSIHPFIFGDGNYILVVTDTVSGCTTSKNIWVDFKMEVGVFSPNKNTIDVEITPTVANDEIRVHYVMEKTNSVSVQIYNIGGALLQGLNLGRKQTGDHIENISLKDLTAGIYFVFVKTEEGSAVRKVVKM